MKISPSTYLFVVAGAIAIGLIGLAVFKDKAPSAFTPLAQCMTKNGAKMYGAWWCPHCEEQRRAFGNAFSDINYIECSPNQTRVMSPFCQQEGIKGFPTWRFADGTELGGEQTVETLAQKTGCEASLPPKTP